MTLTDTPRAPTEQQVADLVDELLTAFPPVDTEPAAFLGEQFDRGLGWVHFPVGHGGLGLSPKHQKYVNERLAAAGGPNAMLRNPIGYGMCGPTVVVWGSDEQKQRYLRPLFTGEEIWCQLFSEPGAGSDFAGLAARGVQDGDEWVVNGQKVWTSLAHVSRWGLLVVRTDPDAVKHAGLTAFVVDMHAPGVEVRPLRQMTGDAEFNEVYFTDVRIPPGRDARRARRRLAGLAHHADERAGLDRRDHPAAAARASSPSCSSVWRTLPAEQRTAAGRDEVVKLWVRAEVLRLTNIRASGARKLGDPGPEGSIAKAAAATLNKDVLAAADHAAREPSGMLYGDYDDAPAAALRGVRQPGRTRSCAAGPTRSRAAPPR